VFKITEVVWHLVSWYWGHQ